MSYYSNKEEFIKALYDYDYEVKATVPLPNGTKKVIELSTKTIMLCNLGDGESFLYNDEEYRKIKSLKNGKTVATIFRPEASEPETVEFQSSIIVKSRLSSSYIILARAK